MTDAESTKVTEAGEGGALDELASFRSVQPIERRKMVMLVNHFITSSTVFINKINRVAEEKLNRVSQDITRIDVGLKILEAKLSSIKGLEGVSAKTATASASSTSTPTHESKSSAVSEDATSASSAPAAAAASTTTATATPAPAAVHVPAIEDATSNVTSTDMVATGGDGVAVPAVSDSTALSTEVIAAPSSVPVVKVKDDPMYSQFFRMLRIRVPIGHVKAKMAALGVDPDVIDMDPDAPSPNGGAAAPVGAIEE